MYNYNNLPKYNLCVRYHSNSYITNIENCNGFQYLFKLVLDLGIIILIKNHTYNVKIYLIEERNYKLKLFTSFIILIFLNEYIIFFLSLFPYILM